MAEPLGEATREEMRRRATAPLDSVVGRFWRSARGCAGGDVLDLLAEVDRLAAELAEARRRIAAATPIEYRDISPQCVVNNGSEYAAWYRATQELWPVYLTQRERHPDATLRLSIAGIPGDKPQETHCYCCRYLLPDHHSACSVPVLKDGRKRSGEGTADQPEESHHG